MNPAPVVAVVCVAWIGTAEARIGENFQECLKRYGDVYEEHDFAVNDAEVPTVVILAKGSWQSDPISSRDAKLVRWQWLQRQREVDVIFQNNKAVWMRYSSYFNDSAPMPDDLTDLIKENLGDLKMEKISKEIDNSPVKNIPTKDSVTYWQSNGSEYAYLRIWQREVSSRPNGLSLTGRIVGEDREKRIIFIHTDYYELVISAEGFAQPKKLQL